MRRGLLLLLEVRARGRRREGMSPGRGHRDRDQVLHVGLRAGRGAVQRQLWRLLLRVHQRHGSTQRHAARGAGRAVQRVHEQRTRNLRVQRTGKTLDHFRTLQMEALANVTESN